MSSHWKTIAFTWKYDRCRISTTGICTTVQRNSFTPPQNRGVFGVFLHPQVVHSVVFTSILIVRWKLQLGLHKWRLAYNFSSYVGRTELRIWIFVSRTEILNFRYRAHHDIFSKRGITDCKRVPEVFKKNNFPQCTKASPPIQFGKSAPTTRQATYPPGSGIKGISTYPLIGSCLGYPLIPYSPRPDVRSRR